MSIDIKTTVIHCKRLLERKKNMMEQLTRFNFTNYSFYEEFDANELNEDIVYKYHRDRLRDPKKYKEKRSIWAPKIPLRTSLFNLAEISLTIKFGKVFEILNSFEDEYFLIFEDDVILCDDFDKKLHHYLNNTPENWDAIYFGSCMNVPESRLVDGQIAYIIDHPASRCGDSILIKKRAVNDLTKTWFPFHLVSDWELAYQHYHHKHKVYWWEPALVKQGSQTGVFKSELR